MPGRTRRTRLLVVIFFLVVLLVLYNRHSAPVDDYRQYFKHNTVGGGAVIRPKQEGPQNESSKESDLQPARGQAPPPNVDPPTPAQQTTSTTTPAAVESSSENVSDGPTPAPQHDAEPPPGNEEEEEAPAPPPVKPAPPAVPHWSKMPERFPISTTIQLPSGTSIPMPRLQRAVKKLSEAGADKGRLEVVKAVTNHAWQGYREHAWGKDEIKPVSSRWNNPFNGWGATLVDSLDTLWIMGMEKEFEEAVEEVGKIDFTTSSKPDIPIFETTIRYLGGLIAAYDVSGRKHITLLDKAVELAEVMFGIFDTPNRMPQTYYRWNPAYASQPHRAGNKVILAEIGTLSLEFTRLAQLTKEPKYYDAIARITDAFEEWQNNTRLPGMWPTNFDASGCQKKTTKTISMPVPDGAANGEKGAFMVAGDPASVGKTDNDSDQLAKPAPQKSLKEKVAAPEPGTDKVSRDDDPSEGGSLAFKGSKDKVLESLGSSKRKREEVAGPSSPETQPARPVSPGSNSNDPSRKSDAGNRTPQLQKLSGEEVCEKINFASSGKNFQETFTLSGASDSMYEYLPKEFILLGGQVDKYRTMYLDSADAFISKLLYKPMTKDERDILMTGELRINPDTQKKGGYSESFRPEAAHLACFAGGMFAMGGVLFDKPEHVEIGSKLTDGCVWAYNVTATGIMPEGAELMRCEDTWGACPWNETAYWKVLDPYEAERTKQELLKASNTDDTEESDLPEPPKPEPVEIGPQPKEDLNKRSVEDMPHRSHAAFHQKRQAPEPPHEDAAAPPNPQPADNAGESKPQRAENAGGRPSVPQPPTYTPEPPMSHQRYVETKIAEERLPPGYTRISSRMYILRPEAIESVFYMYRITGDQYWRDVGWNMFASIDSHTRAAHGNSAIDDITRDTPQLRDSMESFWLAETLKYFYLLYDDPENWSLDDWVFNTEAHLFQRPKYDFSKG